MATTEEIKQYRKAMAAWGKAYADWQLAHPERDGLQELCDLKNGVITAESTGGDHPPVPPPIP